MSANFDVLLKRMLRAGVKPNTTAARNWFRNKIRDTRVSRQTLLSDSDRRRSRPTIGRMYCYAYDPKYGDKFELVKVTSTKTL